MKCVKRKRHAIWGRKKSEPKPSLTQSNTLLNYNLGCGKNSFEIQVARNQEVALLTKPNRETSEVLQLRGEGMSSANGVPTMR